MTATVSTATAPCPPASADRRRVAGQDSGDLARRLEHHRVELTAFCAGRLRSRSEAEDAVQETLIRAWRGYDSFRGVSSLRTWLYRIAGNVCVDVLRSPQRRALPLDLGAAPGSETVVGSPLPSITRIAPFREAGRPPVPHQTGDPADAVASRDAVRLAFVRLQRLPPRQRAVLVLCEVLRWQAIEVADLLGTTVASVTSALQRARATLATVEASGPGRTVEDRTISDDLLALYVDAFDGCDVSSLVSMLRQAAADGPAPTALRPG
jgi:RNA polymerase sigma-70 factor (ECF subfamily)